MNPEQAAQEISDAIDGFDPRAFAPVQDGDTAPMCDQLAQAITVAMAVQAGDGGAHFDDIGAVTEYFRQHISALSILQNVLIGLVGISWDRKKKQPIIHRIDSLDEMKARRDTIACVLTWPEEI